MTGAESLREAVRKAMRTSSYVTALAMVIAARRDGACEDTRLLWAGLPDDDKAAVTRVITALVEDDTLSRAPDDMLRRSILEVTE
jgi:hypothetical protein